jgi:hypothetical protein
MQLYAMSNERFNGVSLFANYTSEGDAEVLFGDMVQDRNKDHTISIHTSQNGSGGAKVSLHKSMLKSALTVRMDRTNAGDESFRSLATDAEKNIGSWNTVIDKQTQEKAGTTQYTTGINKNNDEAWVTLAAPSLASTINLDDISVGVLISALENVSFLRAQNGGAGSRLNFAYESLAQQPSTTSYLRGLPR